LLFVFWDSDEERENEGSESRKQVAEKGNWEDYFCDLRRKYGKNSSKNV